MGYPTKVQIIKRKQGHDQYYTNIPMVIVQALNIEAGEAVEWVISREGHLVLTRPEMIDRISISKLS